MPSLDYARGMLPERLLVCLNACIKDKLAPWTALQLTRDHQKQYLAHQFTCSLLLHKYIIKAAMRSLTVLTCDVRAIKGKKPEARYTGLAIRPEELEGITSGQGETIYIASERGLPDGGVEVQIFISNASNDYANSVSYCCRCLPTPC